MLRDHKFYNTRLFEIAVLILVSALVYLPNVGKLTLYKDEWYFIHDASIAGPGVFINMFAIDRPARGLFFDIYYALFSYHALPYGIGAFIWRVIAIIGALWLFQLLWPRDRKVAFGAALLFAVYPGYLWWVSPIEYQPHMASLALEVFSIVFTLKAIQSGRPFVKAVYAVTAILTGWAYIALVDYAIGMEIFKFLCVFLLVRREQNPKAVSLWKTGIQTVRTWLLYGNHPGGYSDLEGILFHKHSKSHRCKFAAGYADIQPRLNRDELADPSVSKHLECQRVCMGIAFRQ